MQDLMNDVEKLQGSDAVAEKVAKWRREVDCTLGKMQHDELSLVMPIWGVQMANSSYIIEHTRVLDTVIARESSPDGVDQQPTPNVVSEIVSRVH